MQGAKGRGHQWFAGMLVLLALGITRCKAYVQDQDITQGRLDAATPPLDGSHTLIQSFLSRRSNLCEIELLPAVYQTPGQGMLNVCLRGAGQNATPLVQQTIDVTTIAHNVPLRLSFAPQKDSAGKAYELSLEGTPGVRVGFWYSSVDAYGEGELQLDGRSSGDLLLTTRCRYDLAAMGQDVARGLWHNGWLFFPLTLLLLLPGYVLWYGLGQAQYDDPIANLAMCLALSLALTPVILLWSTVAGLRWNGFLCWGAFALLALYAAFRLLRTRFADFTVWTAESNRLAALGTLALFLLTLLVRFVQIRNLVLPAWVDSPQHALITQLVAMHGQVPQTYEPLLPIPNFAYHFGFHADTAFFHWLSGLAIPQAMLILGQVLNAACMLMSYLLTWRLVKRKLAALVAALIAGLVSYMPAYYVSWGRYTQLTGLLLLPAAVVAALDWFEGEQRNSLLLGLAAVTQAGLFLTHARVTVFALCFLLAFATSESVRRLCTGTPKTLLKLWKRMGLWALVTLAISAPWLARIITNIHTFIPTTGLDLQGGLSYIAVPRGLLFITRNRELMVLAAIGGIWGLLKRKKETVWVLTWCALVALLTHPKWAGILAPNLLNLPAAVIALFVPLAILGGQAIIFFWDSAHPVLGVLLQKVAKQHAVKAVQIVLALGILATALWGGWGMIQIVNPVTVLATAEDLQAMAWIKENTPPDALFVINARHWQFGIYTGTDGGYWIPQLTGRRTLLPALPYVYGAPDYVQHITAMARVVSETQDANDASFQSLLAQENVSYLYIGAKGGTLTPKMFLGRPGYRPAYSNGAVWIFEVVR